MLDAFAQVELMIAGLHVQGRAAGNLPMLSVLDEQPDSPAAKAYRGEPVACLDFDSVDFTDYVVGRWAATGADPWLRELVRRARHRDGTSSAISGSLYALDILRSAYEGDPVFLEKFRASGFDPSSVQFGSYLSSLDFGDFPESMRDGLMQSSLDSLERSVGAGLPMPVPMIPNAVPVAVMPTPAASPAPVVVMPTPAASPAPALTLVSPGSRSLDVDSINVEAVEDARIAVDFEFPDSRSAVGYAITLDLAERLSNDIQAAMWPLLIPAEGFVWDDDLNSKISFLCVADDQLALERFADAEKFGDPDVPFYPHPGRVVGRVMPREGFGYAGQFGIDQHVKSNESLLAVKCAVAKLAREFLAQPVTV